MQEGVQESGEKSGGKQDEQQFCQRCGMVGHTTQVCPNPIICPRCKEEGHVARVCTVKLPWEFISPFYGLSAYGQGFHFVESAKTEEGIKDMSTTGLVTITAGHANARQIENEFSLKAGEGSRWRWYAKRIGEGKYQLRFPNVQSLEDIAYFTELRMRSMPEVVFKVEKWNLATGSKGALEMAWFRISNIPFEKRSYSNVCMIASKVGLPIEVDKESLHKNDYVKVKIGCRDVTKVPASVDGVLDFQWYDYFFQREVPQEGHTNPSGNKWIRTERDKHKDDAPSPKKQRREPTSNTGQHTEAGTSKTASSMKGKQASRSENHEKVVEQGKGDEEDSEYDDLLDGDLIAPGGDRLNFGSFEAVEIRKLSCIYRDEGSRTLINEYGSNLEKYKSDPLATIDAKNALHVKGNSDIFQLDNYMITPNPSKSLSTIDEEEEDGIMKERAISVSPAKGSQGAPEIDVSSQEEGIHKGNQERDLDLIQGKNEQDSEVINVDSAIEELCTVTATKEDKLETEPDVWEVQGEKMLVIEKNLEDKQDGWCVWQDVRQSKRLKNNGTSYMKMGEQMNGKVVEPNVENEGMLRSAATSDARC